MVSILILILYSIQNTCAEDTLKVLDCTQPTNIHILENSECHFQPEKTSSSPLSLLQKIHIRKFTGFGCSLKVSTLIGYCGAYSHTKMSGISTYAMPQPIKAEECLRIVNEGIYSDSGVDINVKVDAITSYNLITHGIIKHTATNFECTGQTYRLPDGTNMDNALVYKHYIFKVHTAQLIDEDGVTILPTLQVELGPTEKQKGYHDTTTYIWSYNTQACDLMYIGDFPLSENNGVFMSTEHGIKIQAGQKYHYAPCNLLVREGDSHQLYIADSSQDISTLHKVDVENASPDLHYTTQLKFLHHMARSTVQSTLQRERHPECRSNPEHDQILPISKNRFYRNLGDISITFTCTSLTAMPRILEECYKRIPAVVQGRNVFIDPYTRIVHNHASKTPCILGLPPAVRSTEGEYITFLPHRMALHPFDAPAFNFTQDTTTKGLYQSLVAEHLKMDFLQHYSSTSYAIISNLANSPVSPSFDSNSHRFIADQLTKLTRLPEPKFFCGLNLSELAQLSAVAFCVYLTLSAIMKIVGVMLRLCVLRSESKLSTAVMRAAFTDLYLLSKSHNKN